MSDPARSPPWRPDRVVGAELALELVRTQFPELEAREARPLGYGWDNTAYLVGDVVFRFPRRSGAAELLRREARVLPRLAVRLPLPVPRPAWLGAPSARYPRPFLGHRRLDGQPASEGPPPEDAEALGRELGAFLRTLHGIRPATLALPGDRLGRLDVARRLPRLGERLRALAARGLVAGPDPWLDRFASPAPDPPGRIVTLHGDLYARHLLVDADGRPRGVIDWGDMHAGEAAVDLSLAWGFLQGTARAGFLAAYGPVDAATGWLARFRAADHGAATALYALERGDASLLRAALAALSHVASA